MRNRIVFLEGEVERRQKTVDYLWKEKKDIEDRRVLNERQKLEETHQLNSRIAELSGEVEKREDQLGKN